MSYLLYSKLLKATGWDFSHDDLRFLGFPRYILEPLIVSMNLHVRTLMTNDIEMIYLANVICKGKDLVNASKIWKFVFHIPRVLCARTTLKIIITFTKRGIQAYFAFKLSGAFPEKVAQNTWLILHNWIWTSLFWLKALTLSQVEQLS